MASYQLLACFLIVYYFCVSHIHSADFNEDNFDEEALNILNSESRERRVVGGKVVEKGDWPWLAHLYGKVPTTLVFGFIPWKYRTFHCSASLVADRYVLTAAHCIKQASGHLVMVGKYWHVTVGEVDPDKTYLESLASKIKGTSRAIHGSKIILHPEYNPKVLYKNDIAIIKLEKPVPRTSYSYPVQLPNNTVKNWPADGAEAVLAGWGCTEDGRPGSDKAHYVTIPIHSESTCSLTFGMVYYLSASKRLCAGSAVGTCSGDSGGPLVVKLDGKYVQAGVTSLGASGDNPSIFVRVSEYVEWIRDTMANN